ncbi:MAG: response regulator [Planctomycetes bacterium]|nr:response regulator [Planctomycetota bacterium]
MTHETIGRPMEILLVEDSLTFARLAIHALRKGQLQHRLTWLTDGVEAWDFLQRTGKYVNAPRPDLLLLDLNLPGMDGLELLTRIRADADLQHLPVVVMTGDGDAFAGSELSVEAFLTKPLDFEKFIDIVQKLSHLWQADMIVPIRSDAPATGDEFEPF